MKLIGAISFKKRKKLKKYVSKKTQMGDSFTAQLPNFGCVKTPKFDNQYQGGFEASELQLDMKDTGLQNAARKSSVGFSCDGALWCGPVPSRSGVPGNTGGRPRRSGGSGYARGPPDARGARVMHANRIRSTTDWSGPGLVKIAI